MKRNIVRLTEAQLHQVIKESVNRILSEMKYPETWDSTEDMTAYRDMYSPEIVDNPDEIDYFSGKLTHGNNPFFPYRSENFYDKYDVFGNEYHNKGAAACNSDLKDKLSTKGGQMKYDWNSIPKIDYDRIPSTEEALNDRASEQEWKEKRNDVIGDKAKSAYLNGEGERRISDITDRIKGISD